MKQTLPELKEALDSKLGKNRQLFWDTFVKFLGARQSRKEWESVRGTSSPNSRLDVVPPEAITAYNKFAKKLLQASRVGYRGETKIKKHKGILCGLN
jgi:hypothetical protein